MKKVLILMSVFAFTLMSCGNKTNTPSTKTENIDTVAVNNDTITVNNDSIVKVENDTINEL